MRRQLTGGLLALMCCLFGAGSVRAQQADEQAVKAGFIYNFIKFTQWSSSSEGDSRRLVVCTTSDRPLGGHFAKLAGRYVGTRPLEMRTIAGHADWPGCDVLFFPQADSDRVEAQLRALGNAPVLTLGDTPGFTKAGGMIGLRMQDSRVKFDVNLGSAQRAGLQLNSQMLKLAGEVLK